MITETTDGTVIASGVHDVGGVPYRYEIRVDVASLVDAYVDRAARNKDGLATLAYGRIRVTTQPPSSWMVRNPDGTWTQTTTAAAPK